MESLTTTRLLLRPWHATDADFVFDLYSRWEVQRFIGRVPRVMESREEAARKIVAWQSLEHPVHGIWAVTAAGTGARLGTLLLKSIPASGDETPLPPSGDTEIGWHFHPDAWGHGYTTEAATAVLGHAFSHGLDTVVAVTHPENAASQRVCERIGMTRRGLTTKYYNTECELFVAVSSQ